MMGGRGEGEALLARKAVTERAHSSMTQVYLVYIPPVHTPL